jgi:hypothetical protein
MISGKQCTEIASMASRHLFFQFFVEKERVDFYLFNSIIKRYIKDDRNHNSFNLQLWERINLKKCMEEKVE